MLLCLLLTETCYSLNKSSLFKSTFECNPETQHLFGKFFIQKFFDARVEIGLLDHNKILKDEDNIVNILYAINGFNPGIEVFFLEHGIDPQNGTKVVPYAVIWKCISDGVIHNLHPLTTRNRRVVNTGIVQTVRSQGELSILLKVHNYSNMMSNSTEQPANVFTIIREPLDRFMSGFTESVFRTSSAHRKNEKERPPLNLTVDSTRTSLNKIFDLERPYILQGHFYPMSGVLFSFYIQTAIHFENFKSDWENIIKPSYGITAAYKENLGSHPTAINHPKSQLKGAPLQFKLFPQSIF